jgi:arylsulfatase A-like enzyme
MMKKIKFLKNLAGALAILATGGCNSQVAEQAPNVLIIHTDEQSFRSLSCYDSSWPEAETPNIDRLAEEGVRLENFFANHPVCTPSRAALLTGQYAHEVQSYLNDIPMADDAVTFAEVLQNDGYQTAYIGKWHLDGEAKPGFEPARKFGFADNRFMFNRGHWKQITEVNGVPEVKTYEEIGDEQSYTTDFLGRKTIEFIKANVDKKWCCFLSIPDPHGPDVDRQPYNDMVNPSEVSIPSSFTLEEAEKPKWASEQKGKKNPEDRLRNTKARYLGMVKHIDDCVGQLVRMLKENNQLDNTIVVFTSDHGDMMGEFGRYNKGIPLDGSAKVAHIVRYPKQLPSNTVVREVVSNVDFFPTLLDLTQVENTGLNLRGESYLPLMKGADDINWKDMAFISLSRNVSVVTSHYKLVYSQNDDPWLYDRKKDPGELVNCFADPDYANVIKELTLALKDYLEETQDPNWISKIGVLNELRGKKDQKDIEFTRLQEYIQIHSK